MTGQSESDLWKIQHLVPINQKWATPSSPKSEFYVIISKRKMKNKISPCSTSRILLGPPNQVVANHGPPSSHLLHNLQAKNCFYVFKCLKIIKEKMMSCDLTIIWNSDFGFCIWSFISTQLLSFDDVLPVASFLRSSWISFQRCIIGLFI